MTRALAGVVEMKGANVWLAPAQGLPGFCSHRQPLWPRLGLPGPPPWHLVSPAEPPSCTAKAPSALQAPAKAELPPQEHWLSEKPLPCSPSPMMPPSAPTTPAAPSGVKTLADLSRAESRVLSVGSS